MSAQKAQKLGGASLTISMVILGVNETAGERGGDGRRSRKVSKERRNILLLNSPFVFLKVAIYQGVFDVRSRIKSVSVKSRVWHCGSSFEEVTRDAMGIRSGVRVALAASLPADQSAPSHSLQSARRFKHSLSVPTLSWPFILLISRSL